MTNPKRPYRPPVNDSLLTRESWKIFQVVAEFVEGYERLVEIKPSVSIFGSTRIAPAHAFYTLTEKTAELLSNAGYSVVSGGGPGLMEAANKGAYQGKSSSIGLNIILPHHEAPNPFQDISLRFRHFFTRKVMFVKYANAFVVMPGGFGTLDELAEILALIQTGKAKRIPVILVNKAFWSGLLHWLTTTVTSEGMIDSHDMALLQIADKPEEVLDIIENFYKERKIDPAHYNQNRVDS